MGDRPLTLADGQPVPDGPGVYLLHYVDPATGRTARYRHAGHYTGVADKDLKSRLRTELAGTSGAANLLKVVYAAGLGAVLDQVWPGKGRDYERRLKNRGGAAQYCTRCRTEQPTTRGRQRQHASRPATVHPHDRQPADVPPVPAPAATFLRLNPAFQRPGRAPQAIQYARARGREEAAVLTDRVRVALEDDNHRLSQNRAATVIRRGKAARARAAQQYAEQRRDRRAEQQRPARLSDRTRQQLPPFRTARPPVRARRAMPTHQEVAQLER